MICVGCSLDTEKFDVENLESDAEVENTAPNVNGDKAVEVAPQSVNTEQEQKQEKEQIPVLDLTLDEVPITEQQTLNNDYTGMFDGAFNTQQGKPKKEQRYNFKGTPTFKFNEEEKRLPEVDGFNVEFEYKVE